MTQKSVNITKIGWCDSTWNPVTGCKRAKLHPHCYAETLWNRFRGTWGFPDTPFSEIVSHPERLKARIPRGHYVFTGSMSDCAFWSEAQVNEVMEVVAKNPAATFLFLSHDPKGYQRPGWPHPRPANVRYGATIETTRAFFQPWYEHALDFISVEPFLIDRLGPEDEEFIVTDLTTQLPYGFNVIMGALTPLRGPYVQQYRPLFRRVLRLLKTTGHFRVFVKDNAAELCRGRHTLGHYATKGWDKHQVLAHYWKPHTAHQGALEPEPAEVEDAAD